ncbi:hypothetical protein DKP78_14715, partial [Enterococcus faecium]
PLPAPTPPRTTSERNPPLILIPSISQIYFNSFKDYMFERTPTFPLNPNLLQQPKGLRLSDTGDKRRGGGMSIAWPLYSFFF